MLQYKGIESQIHPVQFLIIPSRVFFLKRRSSELRGCIHSTPRLSCVCLLFFKESTKLIGYSRLSQQQPTPMKFRKQANPQPQGNYFKPNEVLRTQDLWQRLTRKTFFQFSVIFLYEDYTSFIKLVKKCFSPFPFYFMKEWLFPL